MKYHLSLLFLLTFFSTLSQSKNEKIIISKTQLAGISTIQELLPDLPKDIFNYSASMLVNCYGDQKNSASNVCGKIIPGGKQ